MDGWDERGRGMRGPTQTDGGREVERYRQGRNCVRSQKEVSMMQIQGREGQWMSNRVQGTINNRKPEGTGFSMLLLTWTG